MSEQVKNEIQNAIPEKDIATSVFNRVNEMEKTGQLMFPANYAVGNALKSAYLLLQENQMLLKCSKPSIANALLDMVVQGLNPQKKQCYFIPYGEKLQLMRSYFGEQAVVKRADPRVKDIYAVVIYEGDEIIVDFDEMGHKIIKSHKTKFENQDNKIVGAYSIINIDGYLDYEIMTKKEIDTAWSKAKTKNVQNDFPQEMAKRTVIKRHCKRYMNTSDDSDLYVVESYNRTTKDEYINEDVNDTMELQQQVEEKANKEVLTIDIEENQTEKAPF